MPQGACVRHVGSTSHARFLPWARSLSSAVDPGRSCLPRWDGAVVRHAAPFDLLFPSAVPPGQNTPILIRVLLKVAGYHLILTLRQLDAVERARGELCRKTTCDPGIVWQGYSGFGSRRWHYGQRPFQVPDDTPPRYRLVFLVLVNSWRRGADEFP